eukprot:PhF_6_TR412/c2_g1_i5/m.127
MSVQAQVVQYLISEGFDDIARKLKKMNDTNVDRGLCSQLQRVLKSTKTNDSSDDETPAAKNIKASPKITPAKPAAKKAVQSDSDSDSDAPAPKTGKAVTAAPKASPKITPAKPAAKKAAQ